MQRYCGRNRAKILENMTKAKLFGDNEAAVRGLFPISSVIARPGPHAPGRKTSRLDNQNSCFNDVLGNSVLMRSGRCPIGVPHPGRTAMTAAKEPSFRESVDLMFNRAVALMDLPPGLEEKILSLIHI